MSRNSHELPASIRPYTFAFDTNKSVLIPFDLRVILRLNLSAHVPTGYLLPSASALCPLCRVCTSTRLSGSHVFDLNVHDYLLFTAYTSPVLMQARPLLRAAKGLIKGPAGRAAPPGGGAAGAPGRGLHTGRPPAQLSSNNIFARVLQYFTPRAAATASSAPVHAARPIALSRGMHTAQSYPVRRFLARPTLPARMPSMRMHNVGLGTARNYSTPAVRTFMKNAPIYIRAFVEANPDLHTPETPAQRAQRRRRQRDGGRRRRGPVSPLSSWSISSLSEAEYRFPSIDVSMSEAELARERDVYFPYPGPNVGTMVMICLDPSDPPSPTTLSQADTDQDICDIGLDLPTVQETHAAYAAHRQTVDTVLTLLNQRLGSRTIDEDHTGGYGGSTRYAHRVYRATAEEVRAVLGEHAMADWVMTVPIDDLAEFLRRSSQPTSPAQAQVHPEPKFGTMVKIRLAAPQPPTTSTQEDNVLGIPGVDLAADRQTVDAVLNLLSQRFGSRAVDEDHSGGYGGSALYVQRVYRATPEEVRGVLDGYATADWITIVQIDALAEFSRRSSQPPSPVQVQPHGSVMGEPAVLTQSTLNLQLPELDIMASPSPIHAALAGNEEDTATSLAASWVLPSDPEPEYDGSDEAELSSEPDSTDWGELPVLAFSGAFLAEIGAN